MANIKSSEKSARQTVIKRARNAGIESGVKSAQKRFRDALAQGKTDVAKPEYVNVVSALDKAAKRGVIHKNAANRRKSRAAAALRAAAVA